MDQQNTDRSIFDLHLNDNAKSQLRSAAIWAGITAVLWLISNILGFVNGILVHPTKTSYRYEGFTQERVATSSQGFGSIFTAVISLAIGVTLFYFLNKFSRRVKTGLNGNNQETINEGLGSLSSYFITMGVLVILCLTFVVFAVALGLSVGK